jgi:hypothetical protein
LKSFGWPLEYQNISCFGTPKSGVPKLYSTPFFRDAAGVVYYKVLSLFSKTSFKAFSSTTTQTLAQHFLK